MTTALITGANRSIGLETAKQLSQKGVLVYLGSRDLAKGEAIVKELNEKGFQKPKSNRKSILRIRNQSRQRKL